MAKRSKYATGKAFSIEVCDSIRHHAGMADALTSQRDIAFEARDAALGKKHEAKKDSDEYNEACEEHSNAEEKIKDLNSDIKWHTKKLVHMGKKADAPDLEVEYERPDEPPPKLKEAKTPKEDKTQLKMQPEAPTADGEAQHLAADISELDLPGPLQAKMRKANVSTVSQLVKLTTPGRSLRDELDLGNAKAVEVEEALGKYLKRHTRAQFEADKEGAAPKR